jgi:hypothetical protein
LIQAFECLADSGHDCCFNLAVSTLVGGIECTRDAQNRVEVGGRGDRELGSGRAKRGDVAADDLAIEREGFAGGAL